MPKLTPNYVLEFMDAVYPAHSHLAMSFNTEEQCLKDATNRIKKLTRALQEIDEKGDFWARGVASEALETREGYEDALSDLADEATEK